MLLLLQKSYLEHSSHMIYYNHIIRVKQLAVCTRTVFLQKGYKKSELDPD